MFSRATMAVYEAGMMGLRERVSSEYQPIPCPCCGHEVDVPALDVVIQYYSIPRVSAQILRAVWSGKGKFVPSERIFDAMYEDDPTGGPSVSKMYNAMKIGVWRLRNCLEGSGIEIEHVRGRGYRLRIGAH